MIKVHCTHILPPKGAKFDSLLVFHIFYNDEHMIHVKLNIEEDKIRDWICFNLAEDYELTFNDIWPHVKNYLEEDLADYEVDINVIKEYFVYLLPPGGAN